MANDVSKLSSAPIEQVIQVLDKGDVIHALQLGKPISMRGTRHTMGGHTIAKNGIILDMTYFNNILSFNASKMEITVQPGMTWSQLIEYLDPHGLSPMILQSYSSFSIGGTIAVNAHGITDDYGLYKSILSIKMMDYKGDEHVCSRNHNQELFSLVVGGYGLFGVILEVTLQLVPNVQLDLEPIRIKVNEFHNTFQDILKDQKINIKLARVDITNMNDICVYAFREKNKLPYVSNVYKKQGSEMSKFSQLVYKWAIPNNTIQKIRFKIEKLIDKPLDFNNDSYSRNMVLYESAEPMASLYSPLIDLNVTHILQEYFIPSSKFNLWMTYLQKVFDVAYKNVTLLNLTIRYVYRDDVSFLKYAKEDVYAFVLYFRLNVNAEHTLQKIHNKLTQNALSLGGTFYLPYRHHYSDDQLVQAYPEIWEFFKLKSKYDPTNTFTNMWFNRYSKVQSTQKLPIIKNIQPSQLLIKNTNDGYNLKRTLKNPNTRIRLILFLKHVFNISDHIHVMTILLQNVNLSDREQFLKVQEYVKKSSNIKKGVKGFRNLIKQKDEMVQETHNLLTRTNKIQEFTNYLSIGDPGRYSRRLLKKIDIKGKCYFINHHSDNLLVEQGFFKTGKVHVIRYEDIMTLISKIPTVDLITCYIGLHHFNKKELDNILKFIYEKLSHNGVFILRDHNRRNLEDDNLLNSAHTLFNAITMETFATDKNELRIFNTISSWSTLLEKYGFINTRLYEVQKDDPTDNMLMAFVKTNNIVPQGYNRPIAQGYQTLTEWYLVDVAKEYGNFLEHTPYFSYPYFKIIKQFWTLWSKSLMLLWAKEGFWSLFSEYTLMNFVIGIILTFVFVQLSILSFIPRLMYSDDDYDEQKIYGYTNNNKLIKLPRYKKFTQGLLDLADVEDGLKEISGQNELLVKIRINDNNYDELKEELGNLYGTQFLYDYKMLDHLDYREVIYNFKINSLLDNIRKINQTTGVQIAHIYDN